VVCFGPTAAPARLEGSKAFAKEVMAAAGVATAAHTVVDSVGDGLAAIRGYPAVVKADGLAAGKGVVIAADEAQAREALEQMLVDRRFGDAPVVIEEYLHGAELSVLAICDGEIALPLAPARDFKRIGDGDTGPNTGGMGSYSPVVEVDAAMAKELAASVHRPVIEELAQRGSPFVGLLYAGLMLTDAGPKVLEFNCRFGDPETQSILPRLRGDLLETLASAAASGLTGEPIEADTSAAVTVVLAGRDYPAHSDSGTPIDGLDEAEATGALVFHAGTAMRGGQVVTNGGRVLNVTAMAPSLEEARRRAYGACELISFDGMLFRRDIAARAVNVA
jgi:phosphoribosylamine---glycine ligase